MKLTARLLAAVAVLAGLSIRANAAFLVTYTTPGFPASLAPTTVDPNVGANSLNFLGSSASQFPFPNVVPINIPPTSTTPANAIADGAYMQFTVSPNPGFVMNLSSLSFDSAYGIAGAGWAVTTSADGYASIVATNLTATGFPTFTNDVAWNEATAG